MLCVLDKYAQFEYVLLRDSDRFFETEGAQLVNVYDTARFLSLVDRRLQVSILSVVVQCVCSIYEFILLYYIYNNIV